MALVSENFVFYHLPKTGGTWARTVIRRLEIPARESGQFNGSELHPHESPEVRNRFAFCFVRHPESWYESYWAFKTQQNNWGVRQPQRIGEHKNEFDADCRADTFEGFIRNVIERWPGHYSKHYVRRFAAKADFVGRYDRLAADLIKALAMAGIRVDPEDVRNTAPQRVAGQLRRFRRRIHWPDGAREALMQAERETMERFFS